MSHEDGHVAIDGTQTIRYAIDVGTPILAHALFVLQWSDDIQKQQQHPVPLATC
jgi:hypothetical protein